MPYSKNYPKALTIWVSEEMFDKLTTVSAKTGIPKTRIIRAGIDSTCDKLKKNTITTSGWGDACKQANK